MSPENDQNIQLPFKRAEFIVFDLETTGGNPEKNGITEVFALRYVDGEIVDTFYTLVNPQQIVPPIVRKMTGINNRMLKNAPVISQVMPSLVEFIGEAVLVSHNTLGDLKFLRYFAMEVCNRDLSNYFLCTHLLSEKLLGHAPDKSLQGLGQFLNLGEANAHRAEDDTYLTLGLFKILLEKLDAIGIKTVIDAIRLQADTGSSLRIGWGISPHAEKEAPRKAGVIKFFDRKDKLIFATASFEMSRTMKQLKQTPALPKKLFKTLAQAYKVSYEEEASIIEAMLSEAKIFANHKDLLDANFWQPRQVLAILIKYEDRGHIRVQIGIAEEGTLACFGPLHDRKMGMTFIDDLAKVFGQKASRRGFIVSNHYYDLLEDFFSDRLEESKRRKKSLVKSLFAFVGLGKNRLAKKTDLVEKLLQLRRPNNARPLLRESGFLSRPAQDQNEHVVYTIASGKILESELVANNLTDWIKARIESSTRLGNKRDKEIRIPAKGLSRLNAYLSNATMWLIYSCAGQNRRQGLKYWDIDKITTMR